MPKLKVGIFNPYLDTFGGGEKDNCVMAESLSEKYDVDIVSAKKVPKEELESRFNVDLKGVTMRHVEPYKNKHNIKLLGKMYFVKLSKRYDIFVNMVNGLPFPCFARVGVLRIQFPFTREIKGHGSFSYYRHALVYSEYARGWVNQRWGLDALVLHPPVEIFGPGEKQNIILSVGRFFLGDHNKKHMTMICSFKNLCNSGLSGWEYHLLGSAPKEREHKLYLEMVKGFAKGYPVYIHENASFDVLAEMYKRSKFFVHAAGYGEDPEKYPERYEHFGLTTVEAMSAGCVPVVINGGGQPELVKHEVNGLLWNTEHELSDCLRRIINDRELYDRLSGQAMADSKRFSRERFGNEVLGFFDEISKGL